MARTAASPTSSECTTQRADGSFCQRPADDRFPNRICAHHAIKVHLAVKQYLGGIDVTAFAEGDGFNA
ncbi:MAG: hypothetical protein P1U38_09670 [Aeromicrobium sp.]|uniref:hypothetical protein n=1 Tax=Aeromicrobium sp. TaxID=1871063 RepID=UPI00261C8693|nr:hypothetical protein [Aeromicrobium sp.]MDF1705029.1 hypothetical protein [Aeromicrobium sp.]